MKNLLSKLSFSKIFLFTILLAAIFLRFYNLRDSLMFQGDQGRDALVVSQIFKNLDPVFIGPVTSIGNMYLGPFYYYFMLPFLLLTYPDPMGPVYAVAAIGVLTVWLLFKITRQIFDQKTAYLTTFFFTFSAAVVNLSRFSWNPNLAPFFSLLMFYFTFLAWKKDSKYWLAIALCFSLLIQLHYVTLLSFSGAAIILFIQLYEKLKESKKKFFQKEKKLFIQLFLSILIFLASLTPLVLFDFKHDFINARSFGNILTKEESFNLEKKAEKNGFSTLQKFFTLDLKDRSSQIIFEPSFGVHRLNHPLLFVTTLLIAFYLFKKKFKIQSGEIVLLAYLIPGIVGVSFYQHQIYEHYIAYLFPFVYILHGLIFAKIKIKWLMWLLLLPFVIFYLSNNWQRYWLKSNSWTIDDIKQTSQAIQQRIKPGEKYNLVLLAPSRDLYGMNYRYFLHTMPEKPVKMEDHLLAEKLFIINEEKAAVDVLNLPIYEIVVFRGKFVQEIFQIENGPEITVLTRYNEKSSL